MLKKDLKQIREELKDLSVEQKISKLREYIIFYDKMYDLGTPVITDSEYDDLYLELERLENENPEFYSENSPTQKIIASSVVTGLKSVKHKNPILSQEKIKTTEGIKKYLERVSIPGVEYVLVQHKLDGLTIVLTYEKGRLVKAVTRGNGIEGFDVTHLALNIPSIPKILSSKVDIKLRGEGIIFDKDFEEINKELMNDSNQEEGMYKTARNLVSGTMRSLDGSVAKQRKVRFIAFDILESSIEFKSDIEQIEFLKNEGFNLVDTKIFKLSDSEGLINYIESFDKEVRPNLEYTIDGLVLKCDSLEARNVLGNTSKYPKWACAYKFESKDATTKLIADKWQVGKTGIITPLGILEPVMIDGVLVSKASLANIDNIELRDVKINDTVMVRRANDVIPQIVASVSELRDGSERDIIPPKNCPCCGTETVREGAFLKCPNSSCEARIENKIKHFVSKDALNIDGLGDKAVELFMQKGFVNSIQDLYNLKNIEKELLSLDGYGKKKVEKILTNIERSKEAPLDRVLYGLSINNLGNSKSKVIASHFGNMRALLDALNNSVKNVESELLNLKDFGDIVVGDFISFFTDKDNLKLIEFLINQGFKMESEKIEINNDTGISGKTFVITGTMSMNRKDMKSKIVSLGGKTTESVSTNTDYLILGEDKKGSKKHTTAQKLGIKIISEEEFNNLI